MPSKPLALKSAHTVARRKAVSPGVIKTFKDDLEMMNWLLDESLLAALKLQYNEHHYHCKVDMVARTVSIETRK